jgi:hypothetical protein
LAGERLEFLRGGLRGQRASMSAPARSVRRR